MIQLTSQFTAYVGAVTSLVSRCQSAAFFRRRLCTSDGSVAHCEAAISSGGTIVAVAVVVALANFEEADPDEAFEEAEDAAVDADVDETVAAAARDEVASTVETDSERDVRVFSKSVILGGV